MTKRLGQPPFIFAIFFAISFLVTGNQATADTTFKSITCNGNSFSVFSAEKFQPKAIVNSIVDKTPFSVGSLNAAEATLKDWFGKPHGLLYGLGFCSAGLSRDDCTYCMQWARDLHFRKCSKHGVGAQIHHKDCAIRYETYPITHV